MCIKMYRNVFKNLTESFFKSCLRLYRKMYLFINFYIIFYYMCMLSYYNINNNNYDYCDNNYMINKMYLIIVIFLAQLFTFIHGPLLLLLDFKIKPTYFYYKISHLIMAGLLILYSNDCFLFMSIINSIDNVIPKRVPFLKLFGTILLLILFDPKYHATLMLFICYYFYDCIVYCKYKIY